MRVCVLNSVAICIIVSVDGFISRCFVRLVHIIAHVGLLQRRQMQHSHVNNVTQSMSGNKVSFVSHVATHANSAPDVVAPCTVSHKGACAITRNEGSERDLYAPEAVCCCYLSVLSVCVNSVWHN